MKWIRMGIVIVILCLCSGCSTRELEERGFPLAMGIDKNEEEIILTFNFIDFSQKAEKSASKEQKVSFPVKDGAYYEAQREYENNTNKVLDYNQLKAIIIGQEFLEDVQAMRDLLFWLEQEEIVARNTCLFVAKEQAIQILDLAENMNDSVGKYLEQMIETREDFKTNKVVTIGKILNQWHNQNEILLIPVLINNNDLPFVTEYAVMDAFVYEGNISVENAMKAFLCQDQLQSYIYGLKSGEVLELQNLDRKVDITSQEEQIGISITLTGEAELKKEGKKRKLSKRKLQKKLNQQMAESLTTAAQELQQVPGMDISNSYILLGGYNRNLYQKYNSQYDMYQKSLIYEFVVDMKIVSE